MIHNTTLSRFFYLLLVCFAMLTPSAAQAQDVVIECDSATILPPDTEAVASGCDADTMFSVGTATVCALPNGLCPAWLPLAVPSA